MVPEDVFADLHKIDVEAELGGKLNNVHFTDYANKQLGFKGIQIYKHIIQTKYLNKLFA